MDFFNWNTRGVNSQERCDELTNKISQSNCNVICLQETKRESFDISYIKKFCPRRLNQFIYQPSIGNSGGIITIWNGSHFNGSVVSQENFQVRVKLSCNLSAKDIYVTNIYAPCTSEGRQEFADWFMQLDSSSFENWIIM